MSQEIEKVRVDRDNGHEDRWAFGNWFYRKESQKYSLAANRIGILVAVLFVATTIILVTRGPSQRIKSRGDPIFLESEILFADTSVQSIPAMTYDGSHRSNPRVGNSRKVAYKGAEHVERPRLDVIPSGSIGEAVLMTAASDGAIRARLTSDIDINGETVLPKGTTLIGVGSSSEDRLKISFSKAILPAGNAQDILAEAIDQSDQAIGLRGSRVSKYGAMVAAAGAVNFIGGLADGLQETETQGGVVSRKSNLRNAALSGAGRAAIDTSNEMVSSWKDKKSVIRADPGTKFILIFN